MAMHLAVSYIPCDTSLREQIGNTIMFSQFKQGDLLYKNCDNTESSDEYEKDSIITPLFSEE